jgi:hypothetical protein
MGDWYTVGLAVGLGAAIGVLAVALLAGRRAGLLVALAAAAVVAAAVGFLIENWDEALGGALGAAAGTLGSVQIVTGALRRGGTRGATALLVALGAIALAAVALIPFAGYLEAVALPALAARLRRRTPERYAGLRSLAK